MHQNGRQNHNIAYSRESIGFATHRQKSPWSGSKKIFRKRKTNAPNGYERSLGTPSECPQRQGELSNVKSYRVHRSGAGHLKKKVFTSDVIDYIALTPTNRKKYSDGTVSQPILWKMIFASNEAIWNEAAVRGLPSFTWPWRLTWIIIMCFWWPWLKLIRKV